MIFYTIHCKTEILLGVSMTKQEIYHGFYRIKEASKVDLEVCGKEIALKNIIDNMESYLNMIKSDLINNDEFKPLNS